MKRLAGIRNALIFSLLLSPAFLPCSFAQEEVPSREVDPEVTRIIQEVSEHLRGLDSFRVEFVFTMKVKAQGMNMNMVTRHSIAMERPNKFAMIHKEGMMGGTVVSDGETLYSYMPMMGTYTVGEAPKDIGEILSNDTAAMTMSPGITMLFPFLMGLDTGESFLSQIDRAEYLGVEEVDGVRCHHLKLSMENVFDVEIWTTTDGPPVVKQMVPDMSKAFEEMADMHGESPFGENMDIEMSTAMIDWEFNIDLPDEVFTFTPPPEATKADSFFQAASPARKPSTLLGKAAPPFTLELLDGGHVDLLDHKGKDIVILDFWATWCGPCRSAMPLVVETAREYADRDVVLYAVNLREGRDLIEKYLADTGLDLRVALDTDGAVGDLYDAQSIPKTVMIGKNGVVQAVHVGFSPNLKQALSRNLDLLLAGVDLAASPPGVEGIPGLIQLLNDDDWQVRHDAIEALGGFGPEAKAAIPALIEALKDDDWRVRHGAASTLGAIGPEAEEAIPALMQATKDEHLRVRNAAATASRKIGLDPLQPRPDLPASSGGAGAKDLGFRKLLTLDATYASVAFSPDGKTLATASAEGLNPEKPGELRLWDVATGEEKAALTGHVGGIAAVAFSPDGNTLATGGFDKLVKLWDVATGKERATLKGHSSWVIEVAFSPDGKILATGSGVDPRRGYSVDSEIKLWDAQSGEERATFHFEGFRHSDFYSIAFSPDSKTLATGSGNLLDNGRLYGRVTLWDVATGEGRLIHEDPRGVILAVGFSPDGKSLASGGWTRTPRLWDVDTGRELTSLGRHAAWVYALAFSPDGKTLATGSGEPMSPLGSGDLKLWDTATAKELTTLDTGGTRVFSLAFSPDGDKLAVGLGNDNLQIWRVTRTVSTRNLTFREDSSLDVMNAEVAFSPDGKTVATADGAGELKLWDVATGAQKARMAGHLGSIAGLAFSPDGKVVATGSVDKTAKLWDVETGEERYTLKGHSSWVIAVAFSPDGKTVATGSGGDPGYAGNNEIKLWDTATGQERATLDFKEFVRNDVYSLAFSPDGKTLASGSAGNNTGAPIVAYESAVGRLTLWDAATGEEKRNLFEGQGGAAILSVAFSPDGQTLAWGDWLGVVRLGNAGTGQVRATLEGHTNILARQGLAFSPDGRFLVTGSGSVRVPSRPGEVKFWDTATGKELAALPGDAKAVKSLMLSPDGKRLVVGTINGNVIIWTIEF